MTRLPEWPALHHGGIENRAVEEHSDRHAATVKLGELAKRHDDQPIFVHGRGALAVAATDAAYAKRKRKADLRARALWSVAGATLTVSAAALLAGYSPFGAALDDSMRMLAVVMVYPWALLSTHLGVRAWSVAEGLDRRSGHRAWHAEASRHDQQHLLAFSKKHVYSIVPGALSAMGSARPLEEISAAIARPDADGTHSLVLRNDDGDDVLVLTGMDADEAMQASVDFDTVRRPEADEVVQSTEVLVSSVSLHKPVVPAFVIA